VFGRLVSSGFHASGAQGRTLDYQYQYLGPFLTENSQLGADGRMGTLGIPESNASRLNNVLIPPGTVTLSSGTGAPVTTTPAVWQHLLAYGPGEEIDPYGVATPNRAGGGLDAEWSFGRGLLRPQASAEFFSEPDPPTGLTGLTQTPYSMTRYRAGLQFDFEPWLAWPLRLGGGLTITDSQNGQTDAKGNAYDLSTQLMDASVEWNAGRPIGAAFGFRRMVAHGQGEVFSALLSPDPGEIWDLMGVGLWYRPTQAVSVDLVSSVGHTVGAPAQSLEVDQNVVRFTVEF
jgi:hypothetical protein